MNQTYLDNKHQLCVILIPEAEGGYSILARDLPGCCEQGETIEEALANIRKAFCSLRECYRDRGDGLIQWKPNYIKPPAGSIQKWIIVEI